jgi:FHA domain
VNFENLQLQVHPGRGIVARYSGAVVVLQLSLATPAFDEDFLAMVASSCEDYGPLPGRKLIRKIAGLVTSAEPDEVSSFAVVAAGQDGLAVMLCGSMDLKLWIGAEEERLSGRDVATWVDRLIREPFDRLLISPSDGSAPDVEPRLDLRDGVVLGSGVTLAPRTITASASGFEPTPARASAQAPRVGGDSSPTAPRGSKVVDRLADEPPGEVDDAGVHGMVSVSLDEPLPESELNPLPVATDEPSGREAATSASASRDEPATEITIEGILCSRDHFNDPKARFCAQCGISMVHQTHNLVKRPRPALGVLVFDDGTTFAVDYDYVIGREPENSELVHIGKARPLVLEDETLRLSREHAYILLREWQVCVADAHSANGTRIKAPDSSEWIRLKPGEPTPISPGTLVGMSDREFQYDSHFAAG